MDISILSCIIYQIYEMLDFYKKVGTEFIVISRGDSTLRGNYSQETRAFQKVWESSLPIDAEIIIPFFAEGGRYTFEDIHYIKQKDQLISCAKTEFAKDMTFGYESSDLKQWIAEKHGGLVNERIISISVKELRTSDNSGIYTKLVSVNIFEKIIVNAIEPEDLEVFLH